MNEHQTAIENRARTWLREAVRSRDSVTVAALRSLLGALGNAEAVPGPPSTTGTDSPHVAGGQAGLGSAEAPRRILTDDDVAAVVHGEIAERRAAMLALGSGERSHRLAAEVVVLESLLGEHRG